VSPTSAVRLPATDRHRDAIEEELARSSAVDAIDTHNAWRQVRQVRYARGTWGAKAARATRSDDLLHVSITVTSPITRLISSQIANRQITARSRSRQSPDVVAFHEAAGDIGRRWIPEWRRDRHA
jgi:hypothetical protein